MSTFVQVLGWIAFVLGVLLVLAGFTAHDALTSFLPPPEAGQYAEAARAILSVILLPIGVGFICNGALMIVFGEIAGDIRKVRRIAETK
jgi:hypothetical protein